MLYGSPRALEALLQSGVTPWQLNHAQELPLHLMAEFGPGLGAGPSWSGTKAFGLAHRRCFSTCGVQNLLFSGSKAENLFFCCCCEKTWFLTEKPVFLAKGHFWGLDARSCCKQSVY